VGFDKTQLEVAMTHIIQLKDVLSTHLPWHGVRLDFLAMFLVALFKVKTVNLAEIATALNPNAQVGSNYRRLCINQIHVAVEKSRIFAHLYCILGKTTITTHYM
jgi:hypothetical protein